ncbi:MAG: basic amino acid/polyamine antiporter [Clostridium argentinense]|uniref:Amino acid permease n=1 Tax=Clostridium faecium TaxID=2762223 RepID=A0ABR8YUW8_9CLOT|nr:MULTISPECIES: basic amino acid/polyamine antiporter [Clostridium]MBD8047783.1 amino acid permease [Clostridium faecium]MBS5823863.1 basic amino acid/polyamine antiporter [Clostridium argentinense]MDU1350418.1 basic amino acid/polyamine antiporter [Clostridium argentinense]
MDGDKKLGLSLLVALGVGSMIGGGIFNSPTDLIGSTNPQAVLLSWIIGGFGVIFLALVFQLLANKRPKLTGGIFTYAKEGFGDFTGFNSAWGYWLSAWLGNVAFFILMIKTLDSLVGGMKPLVSFILASLILWIVHWIQLRGTKSAGIINAIATVAKIIPLLLVIILGLLIFNLDTFNVPNWKSVLVATGEPTNLLRQVNSAMGIILWCFIGVEAATVLSERAKSAKIVGAATILSLLITLALYMLVSIVSMGVVPGEILLNSQTPLADVLARTVIGRSGAIIVKLGLLISLLGCLISWVMLAAEIPYVAAKGGTMPKWFMKQNKNGAPSNSLLLTDILTQIFLLSLLLPVLQSAYNNVFLIATTCMLIPYLFSSLYAIKVAKDDKLGFKDMFISIIASIYSLYVIFAVGIQYLGAALIMYALGIGIYIKAKKEKEKEITSKEKGAMTVIILLAIFMIAMIGIGRIQL